MTAAWKFYESNVERKSCVCDCPTRDRSKTQLLDELYGELRKGAG